MQQVSYQRTINDELGDFIKTVKSDGCVTLQWQANSECAASANVQRRESQPKAVLTRQAPLSEEEAIGVFAQRFVSQPITLVAHRYAYVSGKPQRPPGSAR